MPIDPRIALGYQAPQIESPVNMMGAMANIRNANNQNALAQYQLSSAQRADTVANTLNDAYRQAFDPQTGKIDPIKLRSSVAAAGAGSQLPGIEEGLAKAEAARIDRDIKTSTLIGNHIELSRKGLEGVDANAPDAADQYLAWHDSSHADPVLASYFKSKGVTPEQSRASIMSKITNPDGTLNRAGLTQAIMESKLGADKALENHYVTQNLGGTERVLRMNKYGGGPADMVPGSEGTVTRSPNATPGQNINVNSYLPASEEAQRDFIKSTRATYDQLKNVPATLRNMDKARSLVPKSADFMGPGGEPFLNAASFLNNRLGMNIKTEGVENATTLRSVLFSGVLDNLRKLDAQPTAGQQNILQQALGSIGTDPSALSNVLDAYEDILRDKVDLHNQEVQGSVQRGVKFPYDPTIKLPPRREASPAAGRGTAGGPAGAPTVVRTGTAKDGRKVVELSDGTVQYQ
jgi:hypothetical protein